MANQIGDISLDWIGLERLMHRDPGGRGLASFRRAGQPLDAGALRAASKDLASGARRVAILSGFPIVLGDRVTAETDGPPGALYLAQVLKQLGVQVTIVTDAAAAGILQAGAECVGLDPASVLVCPQVVDPASRAECERWFNELLSGGDTPWSHLIAIERPGPSHTVESFLAQRRDVRVPVETFQTDVPENDRDLCHNMLGESLDEHVAPTHRLFEMVSARKLPITTIAIGDGGNELGMGRFLWEDLVAAIATGPAGKIACRVPADFTLLAGTSNWGAFALAQCLARLHGSKLAGHWFTPEGQQQLLATLVAAGAVDGRTRRAEPTVDGLASHEYASTLAEMLRLLTE